MVTQCEHKIHHPVYKSDEWIALFDRFENATTSDMAVLAEQLFGYCEARIQQKEKEGK